ncbi:hypothetical protein SAY86_004998 [Trapa natans]|uniref:Uncharacterized protein n=1 Tax=Trapa natans TaxID=22666 RepID=A0AAN7L0A6_TRANT|nr:hypothetical protein SAY86_004998 [Trapa natans]
MRAQVNNKQEATLVKGIAEIQGQTVETAPRGPGHRDGAKPLEERPVTDPNAEVRHRFEILADRFALYCFEIWKLVGLTGKIEQENGDTLRMKCFSSQKA